MTERHPSTKGLRSAQVIVRWNEAGTSARIEFLNPDRVLDRVTGEPPRNFKASIEARGEFPNCKYYTMRQARSKHARRRAYHGSNLGEATDSLIRWAGRNFCTVEG